MLVKGVIDEDFVNYKSPSMFISCHSCTFKCDKECGRQVCQNSTLANSPNVEVAIEYLVNRYVNNTITKSVVFGGLEPFDDVDNVLEFIKILRYNYFNTDDVVIYTGYTEEEVENKFRDYYDALCVIPNIIIKYGRFIPEQKSHYDDILGVQLSSNNQYAKHINCGGVGDDSQVKSE